MHLWLRRHGRKESVSLDFVLYENGNIEETEANPFLNAN